MTTKSTTDTHDASAEFKGLKVHTPISRLPSRRQYKKMLGATALYLSRGSGSSKFRNNLQQGVTLTLRYT